MKGWKKYFKGWDKEAHGLPSLIYDKIDFTLKLVMRQYRQFILIKGSSSQETIAIHTYIHQTLMCPHFIRSILTELKTQTNAVTIIVDNSNNPPSR